MTTKRKFKKRPVVVEAEQITADRVHAYLDVGLPLPDGVTLWLVERTLDVITRFHATIVTLEGEHVVSLNDWIITGVHGEKYPCKPDIFEKTYEPVTATEPPNGH